MDGYGSYAEEQFYICRECSKCGLIVPVARYCMWCGSKKEDKQSAVDFPIFDKVTVFHNRTVQVLENSETGEVSIGHCAEGAFDLK